MVVFALVQSLPVAGTKAPPTLHDSQLLAQHMAQLARKARTLQQMLDTLEHRIAQKQEKLEQTAKALDHARRNVETLDQISREKARTLARETQRLSEVASLVRGAKEQEKKYQALAARAREALARKKADLDHTANLVARGRDRLEMVEKAVDRARSAMKKAKDPTPPPPAKPGSPEPEKPQKQGFSLGFASDRALMQLLQHGQKAGFYMLAGNKSWKLSVGASGQAAFAPAPVPASLYKMVRATVPDRILQAGKKEVAAFGKGTVTYGVVLSPDISARLGRLMQGKKGGDLVISSQGEVTLE